MRQKTKKTVYTFASTTLAMKMEKIMKEEEAPGRMIPVPREITAGCGLAFISEPEERERIEALMESHQIKAEQIVELMI